MPNQPNIPGEKLLILGTAERPWGVGKIYQRFLGRYVLDEESGLYFDERTDADQRQRIGHAFLALPRQLREPAYNHKLTVSTTPYTYTAAGNSSTFYGDFRAGHKLSPHIELSTSSMGDKLAAHVAHELSHLFWGLLPEQMQDAYRQYLTESCGKATVEVTEYVHERFNEWMKSLEIPDSESYAENHRACYLKTWITESFCDSVAGVLVDGYWQPATTVDRAQRAVKILEHTGLNLAGSKRRCKSRPKVKASARRAAKARTASAGGRS